MRIPHLHCPREKRIRGERHPRAKLSEADARDILELRAAGMGIRELARWYGIDHGNISRIVSGKKWAHLQRPSLIENHSQ